MDTKTFLDNFWTLVHKEVPRLNANIDAGKGNINDLVDTFAPLIAQSQKELEPHELSKKDARKVIQLIGFVISSIERHNQTNNCKPGSCFNYLPGLEDYLEGLSKIAKHPPRDSHYTYWLWNDEDKPITFTGDEQELFFNRAVNRTHVLHNITCNALRPICMGRIQVTSSDAIKAMQLATDNMMELHELYRNFMKKSVTQNRRNMEPLFFMTQMRTYLAAYPINGRTWTGVNAANLAAQMQLDFLIGLTVSEYGQTIQSRLDYLTEEDQKALTFDMSLPSIFTLLLTEIGITKSILASTDQEVLKVTLSELSPILHASITAFNKLVNSYGRLSAIHWALIQNYLVKAAAKLPNEARMKLAVDPAKGTGGKTHAETEAIMYMRRRHPLVAKLIQSMETSNQMSLAV